ncbi:MAG: DUF4241 domain-containing protein [Planctomycetales bacterium]|nr:DUF4241 domain-containing protein [Planctomycetales bacterium]
MSNAETVAKALREIKQAGGRFSFAIFSFPATPDYYLQFAAYRGDKTLYGEAVGNANLPPEHALSSSKIEMLQAIGWQIRSNDSNPSKFWDAVDDTALLRIVDAALRTFADVYEIPTEEKIHVEIGLEPDKLLEATRESMATVGQRRAEYGRKLPEITVAFERYLTTSVVDGIRLKKTTIGELQCDSGEIIVCDPFEIREPRSKPLEARLPPGTYPLEAIVAQLGGWGKRIAFALIRLSSNPIQKWAVAHTSADSPFNSSFGVDSGLVTFCDVQAGGALSEALTKHEKAHPDGNYFDDILAQDMSAEDLWALHCPGDANSKLHILSSGIGDGMYFHYWGLDAHGGRAALLVDFQLFDADGSMFRTDEF